MGRLQRLIARARSMMRDSERLLQTYCMVILALFALGFMLIELKPLLLPLCFAMFLSLLYVPVIDALTCRSQPRCLKRNAQCRRAVKRKVSIISDDGEINSNCWNGFVGGMIDMVAIGKIPKALAIPFALCTAFTFLGLAGWVVYDAVDELYDRKDEYEERFESLLSNVVDWAQDIGVNVTTTQVKEDIVDMLVNTVAVGAAEGVANFVIQTLLMLVFLIFILFMRSSSGPVAPVDMETNPWAAVKYKAAEKVQRYIIVKTLISLCTGVLVGFMLGLLGAPLPTVFGMLAFFFNFIPSIGSWIATFLPVPVILFDPDQTLTTALLAIALPGAAQVIVGDFIEPHFLGKLCQVAPLVVLVSLMLFGYLWGIGGMVLALPITIVIKLICKQIPHPIPRYIAGMIYGDLTKYKRRLDRQLASLHMQSPRKRRVTGTMLTRYHTDDDSDGGTLAMGVENNLGATDAQLSHIVLHDDDSSEGGFTATVRPRETLSFSDEGNNVYTEDLERAQALRAAQRSHSPSKSRVLDLAPLRVSSADNLADVAAHYLSPGVSRLPRRRRVASGRPRRRLPAPSDRHGLRRTGSLQPTQAIRLEVLSQLAAPRRGVDTAVGVSPHPRSPVRLAPAAAAPAASASATTSASQGPTPPPAGANGAVVATPIPMPSRQAVPVVAPDGVRVQRPVVVSNNSDDPAASAASAVSSPSPQARLPPKSPGAPSILHTSGAVATRHRPVPIMLPPALTTIRSAPGTGTASEVHHK